MQYDDLLSLEEIKEQLDQKQLSPLKALRQVIDWLEISVDSLEELSNAHAQHRRVMIRRQAERKDFALPWKTWLLDQEGVQAEIARLNSLLLAILHVAGQRFIEEEENEK